MSAIGAAGSVLSSIIGAGTDYLMSQKQNQFNADQAQLNREFQTQEREAAQQWNLEQWNRENQYNSMQSQINRALEAGVNPNAIIGSGSGVGQAGNVRTSGQSGSQASATGHGGNIGSLIANSANSAMNNLLAAANIDKTNAETGQINSLTPEMVKKYKAETDKIIEEANLTRKEVKGFDDLRSRILAKTDGEIDVLKANYSKVLEEVENVKKQRDVMDKQIEQADANIANVQANTNFTEQKTKTEEENTKIAANQADKGLWEKFFRDNFNIDPTSGPLQQIIQGLLSGNEKSRNILDQIIGTVTGTPSETPETPETPKYDRRSAKFLDGIVNTLWDIPAGIGEYLDKNITFGSLGKGVKRMNQKIYDSSVTARNPYSAWNRFKRWSVTPWYKW